jgi:hypothetical protein
VSACSTQAVDGAAKRLGGSWTHEFGERSVADPLVRPGAVEGQMRSYKPTSNPPWECRQETRALPPGSVRKDRRKWAGYWKDVRKVA